MIAACTTVTQAPNFCRECNECGAHARGTEDNWPWNENKSYEEIDDIRELIETFYKNDLNL